jgi:glycosyltransferase involved in cell wall biosynthesis/4-hydroxybenzoate polyprenyltransferase
MPSLRKLGRTDNWWDSKIPPVLAFCYASILLYDVPVPAAVRSIGLILLVGLCAGSYGHLINDLFDIEVDRQAGKVNHLTKLDPWQRYALSVLTLILGFAPATFVHYSGLSLSLLAVEYLLPTIYSAPPVRLKETGVPGILCDALGAHGIPCLYTISVFANEGSAAAHPGALGWLLPLSGMIWALCLGLKGIVIHEFQDRAGDFQAGVSTFATGLDFSRVRVLVNRIYSCELLAFLGLVMILLPVCPLLSAAAVGYVAMIQCKISRNWNYYFHEGGAAVSVEWWQISNAFYECYLPMMLALQCAWRHPWFGLFPVLQVVLFSANYRRRYQDLRMFVRNMHIWLLWHGQLHVDKHARVRLDRAGFHGVRVDFGRSGSELWDIRLTRPLRSVRACEQYNVKLELRADKPRRAIVGLWQDHAPWNSLGFAEELHLTNGWTILERSFAAVEDEERAYFGIWLGGDNVPVEIRRCSIRSERAREAMAAAMPRSGSKRVAAISPPPYRVFSCATYWNLTGVHVFAEHLLRGLNGRGVDARLLLTETNTDLVQLPADLMPLPDGVTVEELPVARTASWSAHWVTLVRMLSRQAPCIFLPNVAYRHSCISPKLPSNVCVVGIIQSDDPVHYEHVCRLGRYWDAIVCVSEACARQVAALDPSLATRLHVIPNAVRVPAEFPARAEETLSSSQPLRVIYHGVLNSYQKRILDLAAILDECARREIAVRVTVAGDGPQKDEFLRACEPHLRSGSLRYLGLISNDRVEELLREHDAYVLPSAFEGMPHAMLEAMAQGCVPVVTDIHSAVPELIRDGMNGYRVPVGDIGAFTERLRGLQANSALRTALAAEAHRTLLGSCYDVRAMTESYIRIFDGVLEAARTGIFRRPQGRIMPPPREVAGISIFPMEHCWAVDAAERWLAGKRERTAMRVERFLRHFRYV